MADDSDSQSLKKLKNLLTMLDPSRTFGTGKNRSGLLETLHRSARRHKDYFHRHDPLMNSTTIEDIIPRFLALLRECALSHQWESAMQLLEVMCREVKTPDTTIWKVGVTSLKQTGFSQRPLLEQFVKQVAALRDIAVVEVLVEFVLHHLTQGDLDKAKDCEQDLRRSTQYLVDRTDPRRQTAQTLFESYQGLIMYARWKQAVFQQEAEMNQGLSSQAILSRREPLEVAEEAVDYLTPLKDRPGVWDIFLSRVVEMHLYHGKVAEARQVLEDYASHNPDNPNSHLYLYKLELQTDNNTELRKKHLKNLIRLDPCHPLCLDLYHLVEHEEASSVRVLFDYLDYNHCSNDRVALDLLADRLKQTHTDVELTNEVQMCWESRKDWWPATVLRGASRKREASKEQKLPKMENSDETLHVKRKIYTLLKNLDKE